MSALRLPTGIGIPLAAAFAAIALSGAVGLQETRAQTASTTPVISNIAASSTASGTGATVTWATDIPASTQVKYGTTTDYSIFSALTDTTTGTTSHSIALSALSPNTTYHYAVMSTGTGTTTATSTATSADQTFTTASTSAATTSVPVLSNLAATTTETGATLTWTTDLPSSTQIAYGTTTAYTASSTLSSATTTNHSVTLSGLTPNTTYHYQALSGNTAGTGTSTDRTFATLAPTTLPVISGIASTPTENGATIVWTTDTPATGQIAYGTTTAYTASSTLNSATTTSHTQALSGLTASTTYHYQISSGNSAGTATSTDRTFTTLAPTTLPVISGIAVTPAQNSVTLTWTTDQGASGRVAYGTSTPYTATTTGHTSLMTSHSETITGLIANTLYHFQILAGNAAGTAMSADRTFTTLTSTTTPDLTDEVNGLKSRVTTLENLVNGFGNRISALESQVATLFARIGGGTGTTTPAAAARIDQNGQTFSAGGVIDFGGHDFGHEETVTVTLNGAVVTRAHADGGGNFSTGSLRVPTTAGTYTYLFQGANSGTSVQATITVR